MSAKPQIVRYCKDCMCIDRCVEAFGKYWSEKSNSGLGCACPISPDNTPLPTKSRMKIERPHIVTDIPKEPPKQAVQADLFAQPPAEPPPLTDDDY